MESTLRSHVTRLRARYREVLRAEVRQTVGTESEVEEELQQLLDASRLGTLRFSWPRLL